jgi:hypothetical protein
MLDHFSFAVPPAQFDSIVAWYLAALAPLGYSKQVDYPGMGVCLGTSPEDKQFWISVKEGASGKGVHVAFSAKDHTEVDGFHEAAIKAGGTDNGKPGIREMYHPNFYAAFVRDPLG